MLGILQSLSYFTFPIHPHPWSSEYKRKNSPQCKHVGFLYTEKRKSLPVKYFYGQTCGEDECSFGARSLLFTVRTVLGDVTLACGDTTCSRPSSPGLQRIFHLADLVTSSSFLERGGVPADNSTGSCKPWRSDSLELERAGTGGVAGSSLSLPLGL